ncbi:MAG: hypothetical protein R2845_05835 [Thermomicrobiales bacterium]
MDYGQDLQFGAFITPVVRPIQQAVELTKFAEDIGLDLATFQITRTTPACSMRGLSQYSAPAKATWFRRAVMCSICPFAIRRSWLGKRQRSIC